MKDPRIEQARQKALDVLKPGAEQLERGLALHRNATVVDTFGFAPYSNTPNMVRTLNKMIDDGATTDEIRTVRLEMRILEQTRDEEARRSFLKVFDESGVTCILQQSGGEIGGVRHMSRFIETCARLNPQLHQARTADDIRAAKAAGNHCLMFSTNHVPCGVPAGNFEEGMQGINTYHRLGVRMMHLAYNRRNDIAEGCLERTDAGLSEFGRDAVRYMNTVGVLVDAAHSNPQTAIDAAGVSERPVVVSHSCCRAVYHHDRGMTDEAIKAVAASGGLIGICLIPHFLGERGTIASLLAHIDHAVKLVGADHVGIGTDTSYVAPDPEGMEVKSLLHPRPSYGGGWRPEHQAKYPDVNDESVTGSLAWTNWPLFTVGLVTLGYSDEDIMKIVGGNMLRVLEDVQS